MIKNLEIILEGARRDMMHPGAIPERILQEVLQGIEYLIDNYYRRKKNETD